MAHTVWRVIGTFFQKTFSAGQITFTLIIRRRLDSVRQFLWVQELAAADKRRAGVKYRFNEFLRQTGQTRDYHVRHWGFVMTEEKNRIKYPPVLHRSRYA